MDQDGDLEIDVNNLNEDQRELITAYLKAEYEKNPDALQNHPENLQKFIEEQIMKMQNDNVD